MSVLHTACYTCLRNFRDWKFAVLLLLVPLSVILIGNYIPVYSLKTGTNQKVKLAYLNADRGQIANKLDQYLADKGIRAAFDLQPAASWSEGCRLVRDGKLDAFIYIDKGFSGSLARGEPTQIAVYHNNSLSPAILLAEGFASSLNTSAAIQGIGGNPALKAMPSGVSQIAVSPGRAPRALDMGAYLMLLYFIFYGGMLGSFSMINRIKQPTRIRLDISPQGRWAYAAGLLLGNLLTLFGYFILLIVITACAFGANWGGNWVIILLTCLLYSAVTTAVGMITGSLTRRPGLSVLVLFCLNTLFYDSIMFETVMGMPSTGFERFKQISPLYYSYLAFTDTMFGGPAARIQSSILSLAAGAITLSLLAVYLGRRKAA